MHTYTHTHTHTRTHSIHEITVFRVAAMEMELLSEFRLYTKARCIERHTHTHIKHKVYFV